MTNRQLKSVRNTIETHLSGKDKYLIYENIVETWKQRGSEMAILSFFSSVKSQVLHD